MNLFQYYRTIYLSIYLIKYLKVMFAVSMVRDTSFGYSPVQRLHLRVVHFVALPLGVLLEKLAEGIPGTNSRYTRNVRAGVPNQGGT